MMLAQELRERVKLTEHCLLNIQQHVLYVAVNFCFNADPVPLKLLTHKRSCFELVRDHAIGIFVVLQLQIRFFLINVSILKARCWQVHPIHVSNKKETKQNDISCTFFKQNHFFLFFSLFAFY